MQNKNKFNVASFFDGISCAQAALKKAGLKVGNYYSSEIDKPAQQITFNNFPKTVFIGDINKINSKYLYEIDLLLGGSPCQDLTFTRKGKGLQGDKSRLFFKFAEIKKELKGIPFLFENVLMEKENIEIISSYLDCQPVTLDAGDFSAQSRKRLFWTNINIKPFQKSKKVLFDVMEPVVSEKYYYDRDFTFHGFNKSVCATIHFNTHEKLKRVLNPAYKSHTLTCVSGGYQEIKVYDAGRVRKLTPIEYERLQGLPDNYTAGFSDSVRRSAIGNGWQVDCIKHIFEGLK